MEKVRGSGLFAETKIVARCVGSSVAGGTNASRLVIYMCINEMVHNKLR